MRAYPHKPKEGDLQQVWQSNLRMYQSDTKEDIDAAVRDQNVNFFKIRGNTVLDLACLAYAFESPMEQVRQFLAVACDYAEKAVEFGVKLDVLLYMKYLSLAILCRRDGFRKKLEGLQRHQYTNENIEADDIFYMAAEAMAALSAKEVPVAQDLTTRALVRAKSGQVNKLARSVMEPVLMMEAAVANKDAQGLATAVNAQAEQFQAQYSPKAAKNSPSGLLDVRGVALLMLARQHGLRDASLNVYLPQEFFVERA